MARFHEQARRSVLKSLTFRLLVIASDLIIFYAFTKRLDLTIGLTIARNVIATILYYAHERIWNGVHWGKVHKK